ncbi:MAG: TetR/AcrR family transcriptional regulator [Coleofasciculaceae cyanobacterium SM2_3_26]|nr:TetR/AcrR family transcriptional regulator [Coleofasciculaceae cyanobacterium SM2_3_26]
MSPQTTSTHQRLIHAARELFAELGVRDTTTRRIAELADVNEVTLFRHFGNKHGLFLAVLEESDVFQNLGRALTQQVDLPNRLDRAIAEYADTHLQLLERFPKLICSAIGEADEYSAENRRALGRGLTEVNRHVAQYLLTFLEQEQLQANLSPEIFASLLNGLLLGYLIVEFTTETEELWGDREVFLESLVQLFLQGAVSTGAVSTLGTVARVPSSPFNGEAALELVADLPASTVHEILRQAKRLSFQDYGLAYVAFAAGLTPGEMAGLLRSQQFAMLSNTCCK